MKVHIKLNWSFVVINTLGIHKSLNVFEIICAFFNDFNNYIAVLGKYNDYRESDSNLPGTIYYYDSFYNTILDKDDYCAAWTKSDQLSDNTIVDIYYGSAFDDRNFEYVEFSSSTSAIAIFDPVLFFTPIV